jgi:hypothetical protein
MLRPGQPPLSSAELVAIYEVLLCCPDRAQGGLRRSAELADLRLLLGSSVLFDVEALMPGWRAPACQDLCARFPIASIEDPFDQNDLEGWAALTKRIGTRVQVSALQAASRRQASPAQCKPACWPAGTAHGFAPRAHTNTRACTTCAHTQTIASPIRGTAGTRWRQWRDTRGGRRIPAARARAARYRRMPAAWRGRVHGPMAASSALTHAHLPALCLACLCAP